LLIPKVLIGGDEDIVIPFQPGEQGTIGYSASPNSWTVAI
jgi:hypothetical protein